MVASQFVGLRASQPERVPYNNHCLHGVCAHGFYLGLPGYLSHVGLFQSLFQGQCVIMTRARTGQVSKTASCLQLPSQRQCRRWKGAKRLPRDG